MPVTSTVAVSAISISPVLWLWIALTVLIAAVVGFTAGVFYGRTMVKRAVRRARKHAARLVQVVFETLETAQDACTALEAFPNLVLSHKQTEQMEARQSQLLETVNTIVEGQRELEQAVPSLHCAPCRRQGSGRGRSGGVFGGWG